MVDAADARTGPSPPRRSAAGPYAPDVAPDRGDGRGKWDGDGFVITWDRPPDTIVLNDQTPYFCFRPGRRDGIYAAAGEESQTLDVDTTPQQFAAALFPGSKNFACSVVGSGPALLHPTKEGVTAEFIYRIASPYVAVEGNCEATLAKGNPSDVCRIWLSRDGVHWQPIGEKKEAGDEKVTIDLGRAARAKGRPHVYTAYPFFVKVELSSARNAKGVGIRGLKVAARPTT